MASLVLGHLMNGVVRGIHIGFLGIACDAELVFAGTALSSDASLEIALRIAQHVTQQFSELGSMLGRPDGSWPGTCPPHRTHH